MLTLVIMRCFFISKGHVGYVAFLHLGTDEALIAQASGLFKAKREELNAEGFEVWDKSRFVYRYPETHAQP